MDTLEARSFTMATAPDLAGRELCISDWILIDQSRINAFADTTDDHQWIHVDVERAKRESPFGGPVAHGFLGLSLIGGLIFKVPGALPEDAGTVINYGFNKLRFMAPVRAGARVRDRIKLLSVEPKGNGRLLMAFEHAMEIEHEAKPAFVAEWLLMIAPR